MKFSTITPTGRSGVGNATVALADPLGNLLPGTLRPLTVHGDSSFALVPRRDVYSDRVDLAVKPGQTIAVSLYYPLPDRGGLGNFVSIFATRSVKGDWCAEPELPKPAS